MEPIHRVRLVDLALLTASATDLGMGQLPGSSARKALMVVRCADALGWPAHSQAIAMFASLLRWAGCTSHGHDFVLLFDDEITVHREAMTMDFSSTEPLAYITRNAGRGRGALGRGRTLAAAVAAGPAFTRRVFTASCEVAKLLADQMGLGNEVGVGLRYVFERWDGRGFPGLAAGDAIPREVRLVQAVHDFVVFAELGGVEAGLGVLKARAGRSLDPELSPIVSNCVLELPDGPGSTGVSDPGSELMALEPGVRPMLVGNEVDTGLSAVAQFADLKTPFTLGQSEAIAVLVRNAAPSVGLSPDEGAALAQVAMCQALGRVGVPNGIWEHPGPLGAREWDQVHLYPLYGERLIGASPGLVSLGESTGVVQERLDRSGYYRRLSGIDIGIPARLLQAALVVEAMSRARPYRPSLDNATARTELEDEVRGGRLDRRAVNAVLEVLDHQRLAPAAVGVLDLTDRELEVLRLAVTGLSRRQVATALSLSAHTIDTHLRHIYAKLGVTTRAAAAIVAMQRGLL